MNKRTKIILALCTLLTAGSAATYYFLSRGNNSNPDDKDGSDSVNSKNGDANEVNPTLSRGSRGENVKTLQRFLNERLVLAPIENRESPMYDGKLLDSLAVDGIFGSRTETACVWYFGKPSVKLSEILAA